MIIVKFVQDYKQGQNLVLPINAEYSLEEGECIGLRDGKFLDIYDLYDLEKQKIVEITYPDADRTI